MNFDVESDGERHSLPPAASRSRAPRHGLTKGQAPAERDNFPLPVKEYMCSDVDLEIVFGGLTMHSILAGFLAYWRSLFIHISVGGIGRGVLGSQHVRHAPAQGDSVP